jgi:hypothetical protein
VIQLAPETADMLREELKEQPAALAVLHASHIRIYRCPNTAPGPHRCDREADFDLAQAEAMAADMQQANELLIYEYDMAPRLLPQPLVLVYGVPWQRR